MATVLVIVHALLATALLGAITHQAFSACLPVRRPAATFIGRFRAVAPPGYAKAIVTLYLCTAVLGSILYPEYRLNIRVILEQLQLPIANGAFELKEHFAAIGLALLPAYWLFWRVPSGDGHRYPRAALTTMLAFIVWWNFLVGHVLNNIRGFGS